MKRTKTSNYLRDLAERLRHIPVMYGVDGGDVDQVETLAERIENATSEDNPLIESLDEAVFMGE